MEPNYQDYSCTFMFDRAPIPFEKDPTFDTPCFSVCGSKRAGNQESKEGGKKCSGVETAPNL